MDISGLLSGIGGIIGGISSLFTSRQQSATALAQTQMATAAQRRANLANIAAQKEINQQNVASQEHINSLMRHDANNAISIKKQDLINAGYSTANPDLTGNVVASLTAPNQIAPHVDSEYPAELANINVNASNTFTEALLRSSEIVADVAYKVAQSRETNARATATEKQNAWADLKLDVDYRNSLQMLDNLSKDGKIKDNEITMFATSLDIAKTNLESLATDVLSRKIEYSFTYQRCLKEMSLLTAQIDSTRQNINESRSRQSNLDQDTLNKELQYDINEIEKRLKEIEVNYAELGINFHGSGYFDSLMRIAASPRGHEAFEVLLSFIGKAFKQIISSIKSRL